MTWIGCAGSLLAACGGGGGSGGSGIDPRLSRLDVYEAQKLRVLGDTGAGVMGMGVTDHAAMPTSGAVDFSGFAAIRIEAENPLVLFGDAGVSVTFDTAEMGGQIAAVFGTDSSGRVVDYSGVIALTGGAIGGQAPSDLQLDYIGALTGPHDTAVFDGTVSGSFLGTPVSAIALSDLEAAVTHNGLSTDATLLIVAEAVP